MPLFDDWVLPHSAPGDAREAMDGLLARRILASGLTRDVFLSPTSDHLHDGRLIAGMEFACERIARAIRDGEQILIYGDYDVDGVTSIVLLRHVVSALGGKVGHVVPHRLTDGYGLKMSVLDRVLVDLNVRLVITVDCGITSVEPVERAIERGIDVIITDHHLPPEMLPQAAAVLNPKVAGCEYPYKDLAGVGVAFKLCCELLRCAGRSMSLDSLMKIAALGTIADVAPLTGENRTIARVGLQGFADVRNRGLRALLTDLGLHGRPLRASDVGFRIGPRINAAGRLASADTAIDLFSAKSDEEARTIVAELNRLNSERQTIERSILAQIDERMAALETIPTVVAIAGEAWHKGVLGLCAGRTAQKYHRPSLVMSVSEGECVGSGRSAGAFDLHRFLGRFDDFFTHFGGHEFACGFSLPAARVPDFLGAVARAAGEVDPAIFRRTVEIDAVVSLRDAGPELLAACDALEPFGASNRAPVFLTRGTRVSSWREFSPGCFNVVFEQGGELASATVWRSQPEFHSLVRSETSVDLVYGIAADSYGKRGVALQILDFDDARGRERNEITAPPV